MRGCGRKWEFGLKNRWKVGVTVGGKWTLKIVGRWGVGLQTGGRWDVEIPATPLNLQLRKLLQSLAPDWSLMWLPLATTRTSVIYLKHDNLCLTNGHSLSNKSIELYC